METVDAFRSEGIALDGWLTRTVDKVLFRGRTRELDVGDGS